MFDVTYERVNDQEATQGGTTRHGFVDRGLSLSDAIKTVRTWPDAGSEYCGAYANDSRPEFASWVTFEYREFVSGDNVSLSIHFPKSVTPASRARLVALLAH